MAAGIAIDSQKLVAVLMSAQAVNTGTSYNGTAQSLPADVVQRVGNNTLAIRSVVTGTPGANGKLKIQTKTAAIDEYTDVDGSEIALTAATKTIRIPLGPLGPVTSMRIAITGLSGLDGSNYYTITAVVEGAINCAASAGSHSVVDGLTDIETDIGTINTNLGTIEDDIELLSATVGTPDAAAPATHVTMGAVAETGTPAAVADGDAVAPWYDEYGRKVIKSYEPTGNSLQVTPVAAEPWDVSDTAITALTAPGKTAAQSCGQNSRNGFEIAVSAINTNVLVSIESANAATLPLENTAVANLSITNNVCTITANGYYVIWTEAPVASIVLNFSAENGGTDAVVTPTFLSRRK